jgi:DNA-binding GntR family transcriptional regulator
MRERAVLLRRYVSLFALACALYVVILVATKVAVTSRRAAASRVVLPSALVSALRARDEPAASRLIRAHLEEVRRNLFGD